MHGGAFQRFAEAECMALKGAPQHPPWSERCYSGPHREYITGADRPHLELSSPPDSPAHRLRPSSDRSQPLQSLPSLTSVAEAEAGTSGRH